METIEITKTEALVKVNKLKIDHENKKKEIIDLIEQLNEKEKEMELIEVEYMKYIEKLL